MTRMITVAELITYFTKPVDCVALQTTTIVLNKFN